MLAAVCLAVLVIGAQSAPKYFDFDGMKGAIDSSSVINGVEKSNVDPALSLRAEEIIKAMIHKHLDSKKKSKKAASQSKVKAPETIAQAATTDDLSKLSIKWEDHPETKNLLNERIPGGTASVDALIKLIQEQKARN